MAYHNIYRSWSWVGGHADGDADLLGLPCGKKHGKKPAYSVYNP